MPNLLGTAPNQVPTNADLGKLAFMDVVDTVTNNPYVDTAISDTKPSLLLDFANSKTLDPRITYTRASTATYYDGKTTAKAEENLFVNSQALDLWNLSNNTVTANAATAPDGTTTADRLVTTTAGTNWFTRQLASVSVGGIYTISMWVMSATGSNQTFRLFGTNTVASSDLTATTSWQRFVFTFTAGAGSQYHGISADVALSAVDLYIWGAQLEQRSSVSSYTPTTSSPITNYIPALQTAAAGVPRFDHDPVTGESKGFLIEEQRSNLLTYSADFSNAAWVKINAAVTADTIVAPDGTLTADKWVANSGIASGGSAECYQYVATAAGTYTYSLYLKHAGFSLVTLAVRDHSTSANYARVTVSLTNGLISSAAEVGGTFTNPNATVTQVGNYWYKVSLTFTSGSATAIRCRLWQQEGTGDGFSGIYIWGAQLEAGSFATSYIPTTSAQVTRSADAASMTGNNFSSWYNQAEGTLYASASLSGRRTSGFETIAIVSAGTSTNNSLAMGTEVVGNDGRAFSLVNGSVFADLRSGDPALNAEFKIGFAYKVNDFAMAFNAGAVQTDTSGAIPDGVDRLTFRTEPAGGSPFVGCIRKFAYYPKRLSDAELQEMTL